MTIIDVIDKKKGTTNSCGGVAIGSDTTSEWGSAGGGKHLAVGSRTRQKRRMGASNAGVGEKQPARSSHW